MSSNPTSPFTIVELLNPSHYVPELHKIRRSPDREALKLGKGSSGMAGPNIPLFERLKIRKSIDSANFKTVFNTWKF